MRGAWSHESQFKNIRSISWFSSVSAMHVPDEHAMGLPARRPPRRMAVRSGGVEGVYVAGRRPGDIDQDSFCQDLLE